MHVQFIPPPPPVPVAVVELDAELDALADETASTST